MACKYNYQGKEYTKEDFYNLVRTTMVVPKTVPKYTKILFPTGNTASKIEGHQTLEEFKKQKEDRIKELESSKKTKEVWTVEDFGGEETHTFGSEKEANEWRESQSFVDMWYKPYKDERQQKSIEQINIEINQLKQELERVEKEGFAALRPIYNFYENVVSNILKKQGYKPILITDEYGNTWNEIKLSQSFTNQILLNKGDLNNYQDEIFNKGFTNIQQYIDYIANNNEPLSPLAKNLQRFKKNNPVILSQSKMNDLGEFGKSVGLYDSVTQEIYLNPYNDSPESTILHEYIHAITWDFIKENQDTKEVKELKDLYEYVKTYKDSIEDKYPLTNFDEFITGIFTRSRFIYDLTNIPYKSTSVLTKLLEWFSNLFKFNPKQETLFEEVFFKAEQLLNKIEEIESPDFSVDIQETILENQLNKLLQKYGTGVGNEINRYSEWGKLTSDIAKVNREYNLDLKLYQAPNGNWYLRQNVKSTLVRSVLSNVELNAKQLNLPINEFNTVIENWDNYFDGYQDLSEMEREQFVKLMEQGFIEITCKI